MMHSVSLGKGRECENKNILQILDYIFPYILRVELNIFQVGIRSGEVVFICFTMSRINK